MQINKAALTCSRTRHITKSILNSFTKTRIKLPDVHFVAWVDLRSPMMIMSLMFIILNFLTNAIYIVLETYVSQRLAEIYLVNVAHLKYIVQHFPE